MMEYTKDKLFFENGYVNIATMTTFIEDSKTNYEIVRTPIRILRKVPDFTGYDTNDNLYEYLWGKILIPIFGSEDTATNYLQHVARAIAGHYEDKQFTCCIGLRNSGKGVITDLLRFAFDRYANTTNADVFLCERIRTGDDARKYSFLSDNIYTRLLLTNEIEERHDNNAEKINGSMIKRLTSGGDPITTRKLYENAQEICPRFRIMMFLNNLPGVEPVDCIDYLSVFSMPNKFVNETEYNQLKQTNRLNDHHFIEDGRLREKMRDPHLLDYFVWTVMKAYLPHKVKNCTSVIEDSYDNKEDLKDDGDDVHKYYKFTESKDDFIMPRSILEQYNAIKPKLKIIAWRSALRLAGANDRVSRVVDGKVVKVWTNIKYIGSDQNADLDA
jgi:hypothetical protein